MFPVMPVVSSDFKFRHYLSVKSMHDQVRPDALFIHGRDFPVSNAYFKKVMDEFNATLVLSRDVTQIHTQAVDVVEHKSDVIRLESLLRFGGMYFDFDVFVLRSFDQFLDQETVLSRENSNGLNNGVIFAKRCSRFLTRWYQSYRTFNDQEWGMHSIIMPKRLYDQDHLGLTVAGSEIQSDWPTTADEFFSPTRIPEFWDPIRIIHVYFRQRPDLGNLDEEAVCKLENNYGRIAKLIIAGTCSRNGPYNKNSCL
jgi:hypothetical protein